MSFLNLDDIQNFSLSGTTLNKEEQVVIQSSLHIKKQQEKLADIYFWGKILGVNKDYYVAQGVLDLSDVFGRKYFYSLDMVNWMQLANVTKEEMVRINEIQGRFYGDPAYEYPQKEKPEETTPPVPDIEAENHQEPTPVILNEEKRLAGVVALINYETQIVPRGSFYRDSLHQLQKNKDFEGLDQSELKNMTSYFHFRPGYNGNSKPLLDRAKYFNDSIDIFDAISDDNPKGVWALQVERGGSIATIRSLMWPGYSFFHTPKPAKWGSIYCGTGQRNVAIGYML